MDKLSYHRHRYPSIVIQQAIWLYFRFALSYRDVEDMLAERGIDASYETVRRWAVKFGAIIARKLRRGRSRPDVRWHLDEVFVSINGRQLYCVPWTAKARSWTLYRSQSQYAFFTTMLPFTSS
jgi:putative transposase